MRTKEEILKMMIEIHKKKEEYNDTELSEQLKLLEWVLNEESIA